MSVFGTRLARKHKLHWSLEFTRRAGPFLATLFKGQRIFCCQYFCQLLLCIGVCCAQLAQAQAPNIIFIVLDDQGVGEQQWYPTESDISLRTAGVNDPIQTPTIFRLAQEGVRFTNYYSPAPLCSPARVGILTGRYPHEFGITSALPHYSERGLPPGTSTIASLLQQTAGYKTKHIGKWHIGSAKPEHFPTNFGFDSSLVTYSYPTTWGYRYKGNTFVTDNDLAGAHVVDANKHLAEVLTDSAIDFIEEAGAGSQPYFLNLWYQTPHEPIDPPANFPNLPLSVKPNSTWPQNWSELVADIPELAPYAYLQNHSDTPDAKKRAMYAAMLVWVDYQIGRLIARADELDPSGNTLIIITSDNGASSRPEARGSGAMPGPWLPNGDLRGFKNMVYEGGIRTPLIIRWLAQATNGGRRDDSFFIGYDFLPTLLEAANAPVSATLGSSMLGRLVQNGPPPLRTQPFVWEKAEHATWLQDVSRLASLGGDFYRHAVLNVLRHQKVTVQLDADPIWTSRLYDTNNRLGFGVNESDDVEPSLNIALANQQSITDLNEYYRGWRYQVGRIASEYDVATGSADLALEENSLLDLLGFPTGAEVMPLKPNSRFNIHDGDFSFSTDVLLESLPSAGKEWIVATDPGSWRLSLLPGTAEGFVEVRLAMVSSKSTWAADYNIPGEVLTLSHEVACSNPCTIDMAFTVFHLPYYESTVILYVGDENVASHYASAANFGGGDRVPMYQVYSDESTPILLGNDESGQSGLVGKLRSPRLHQIALTPDEIAGVFDSDGDGVPDAADNCPTISNPLQSLCIDNSCH